MDNERNRVKTHSVCVCVCDVYTVPGHRQISKYCILRMICPAEVEQERQTRFSGWQIHSGCGQMTRNNGHS